MPSPRNNLRTALPRHQGLFFAACMLVPLWPCYSSAPQPVQGVLNSPDSAELPSISAAAMVLRDPNATDAARSVAADTLVTSAAHSPASLAEITDMLGQSVLGNSAGRFILAAIAKQADAADTLLPVLRGRLRAAGVEELPRLLSALGSIRTPQAAGCSSISAGQPNRPSLRPPCGSPEAHRTHRMPSDVVAWAEWLRRGT